MTLKNITELSILGKSSSTAILRQLEQLGRLSADFNANDLLPLLEHQNEKIRMLTAINLGKTGKICFLQPLFKVASSDLSTAVRREATSAIGRTHHKKAIPALIHLTKDKDPKVALQALRGLLAFEQKDERIKIALNELHKHPNELIQEIIQREQADHFENSSIRQNHTASPDFMKNLIVQGDVLKILKYTPIESIHLTFTSPPYYNARDYSIYASYEQYLNFLEKVFKQVHRVTKPGRFFILNTSPIIIPRVGRQHASRRYAIPFDIHPRLVKMGWDFIDDIIWAKPESSVKNRNGGFFQHRKPLGYKPNPRTEYLMVYRKKSLRLLDWNIHQYNQHQLNQSRVTSEYETSNVWNIDPTYNRKHPAVFPTQLCEHIIRYYSFVDDLVFDPFGGSGTLGRTANTLNRHFFMTELITDYIEYMKKRFVNPLDELAKIAPRFINEAQFRQLAKSEHTA